MKATTFHPLSNHLDPLRSAKKQFPWFQSFSMKRPLRNSDSDDTPTANAKTKLRRMGICPSQKPTEANQQEEEVMSDEKMDVVATGEGEFVRDDMT
jgi:hypothetical protein